MQNLKKFLQTNQKKIVVVYYFLFCLGILILNVKPGFHIMGLDNASPFFDFNITFYRIFHASNFFEYGGLFYTLPLTALTFLHIPSWVISQLFVWGTFALGFTLYLKVFNYQKLPLQLQLLLPLFIIPNLVTIWIFSQPILLFVASFAAIPATILLFNWNTQSFLIKILTLVGILLLFATSINPIAFLLYLLQATLIAWAIKVPNNSISSLTSKGFAVLLVWVVITQGLLLGREQKTFVVTEFANYIETNISSPLGVEVTESLRLAEIKNNSLVNVVRFATGWVELNDLQNKDLFQYSRLYARNYFFIALGLVPLGAIIFIGAANKKWLFGEKKALYTYAFVVLITSTYSLLLLGQIPYLRDGLRWISSKTWPSLFILGTYVVLSALSTLSTQKIKLSLVSAGVFICLVIYGFPWLQGSIVNLYSLVKMPSDYLDFPKLANSDVLIVYPKPQKLFFRSYKWGYYGTDFLSYLTRARIVDGTSISRGSSEYPLFEGKPHYFITEELDYQPDNCVEEIIEQNSSFKLSFCSPIRQ